jgi:hypothetical protein
MPRSFLPFGLGHGSRSLSVRGQHLNTFAGIGFSLAFALLALGAYVVAQQFADPVRAQPLNVPLAALLITTAFTLLYCLLRPWRRAWHDVAELPTPVYDDEENLLAVACAPRSLKPEQMPAASRYVDRARIRIPR